ncbi:MAG: hypothetical protein MHM6MM_002102 [Cercozoa sp. M6MM]
MDFDDEPDELRYEAKVVVLGNSGVGKTSLVTRGVKGSFSERTMSTIGYDEVYQPPLTLCIVRSASYLVKSFHMEHEGDPWTVRLALWDTAGQERFRSMAPLYYRGAEAAILVFDLSAPASLNTAKEWADELRSQLHDDMCHCVSVAGNKADVVSGEEEHLWTQAQVFSDSIGAALHRTSAKTGQGVDELFQNIAQELFQKANRDGTLAEIAKEFKSSRRRSKKGDRVDVGGSGNGKSCCN